MNQNQTTLKELCNPKDKAQAHADYILEQINNYGYDIDVMLECKAKELALLEYRKTQLETIQ